MMRWSCYFLIVFLRVFPEKEKERKGRSAEGRRRLSNSPSLACEQALRGALAAWREKETLILTLNVSLLIPPLRQSTPWSLLAS